jgi:hypothetical protein
MPSKMKPPVEVIPPPKLEDSPDFTAEEAASGQPIANSAALSERLREPKCAECGKPSRAKEHALRRHGGVHYSRVILTCEDAHEEKRVFRLEWLVNKGA